MNSKIIAVLCGLMIAMTASMAHGQDLSDPRVPGMWKQEAPGAKISSAVTAVEVAKLRYYDISAALLSTAENHFDVALVQLGIDIPGFAKPGTRVWEVRFANTVDLRLTAIFWVNPDTGDVLPLLGKWSQFEDGASALVSGGMASSDVLSRVSREAVGVQPSGSDAALFTVYERRMNVGGTDVRLENRNLEAVKNSAYERFERSYTNTAGEDVTIHGLGPAIWERMADRVSIDRQLAGDMAFVQYAERAAGQDLGKDVLHDISLVRLGLDISGFGTAGEYFWEVEFQTLDGQRRGVFWVNSETGAVLPIVGPSTGSSVSTVGTVLQYETGLEGRVTREGNLKYYSVSPPD